ncbi:MAG TPA: 3-hydroxyacyl-CoA dehydrogenase NAD-binding domain-containing protein [Gemmatimonadales bacterium]|nr:3-hydroxyacyl-CoA dehydrogenase NAD-binding domain-containing protein [Gemmatimonadales bacterium]
MTAGAIPTKVAVIGAGDIGCGWGALCVAAGWPVAVYDTGGHAADAAIDTVARRARALVALDRAAHGIVERGLLEVQRARSLLQVVRDADWVIEAISEDLTAKQKLFEAVEQVAAPSAVLSSSSSGLPPSEIFGRVLDRTRCLVIHPLNPPELMPLVELVPCPETAERQMDQAQEYLRALGRIPITLKKAVPGYVVGRVAAAVWRECIDLVLGGVIGVSDLDRAVSLGPALGWAAAGPHLTYHLGAGAGGVPMFLQHLLRSFEGWWADLARWDKLEPEQQRALVMAIERAYAGQLPALREARDRRLGAILQGLEKAREETT